MKRKQTVAIVGGGISGLYCAKKLAENNFDVHIFESQIRWGGRIETLDMFGYKAECGPMRFELVTQPLLKNLLKELQIDIGDFEPPESEDSKFPVYELEEREKSSAQLKRENESRVKKIQFSEATKPLSLLKYGIYRLTHRSELELKLTLRDVVENDDEEKALIRVYAKSFLPTLDYTDIRRNSCLFENEKTAEEKQYLHDLGFWNALARTLSPGALNKVRDLGTFYHLMPENPNAAEWSIFWLRLFASEAKLQSSKSGSEEISKKMIELLTSTHAKYVELESNAKVVRISTAKNVNRVKVRVLTEGDEHQRFMDLFYDHVILAIPKSPLMSLTEFFPERILSLVKGVIGFPLLKIFIIIKDPWWDRGDMPESHYGAHIVPTREIHYYDPIQDKTHGKIGMLLLYTDRPATSYWQPYILQPHSHAQLDEPTTLKSELAYQVYRALENYRKKQANTFIKDRMDEIYEMTHKQRMDLILGFAIRDWSKPPYGAACHAWPPGVIVSDAVEELKAFNLFGSNSKNIHICGEAFSDYQGFIEGALRSAEKAVNTIIGPSE